MNLLLLEPGEIDPGRNVRIEGRRARHLGEVLRLAPGDHVAVGELGGGIGTARVLALSGDAATLEVDELRQPPPAPLGIDLLLAMPRPKTLRRLLRAVASMGVKRIVVVNAARVEKSYFDSPLLAPDAIAAELRDGLEQARDTVLPELIVAPRFRPFVEDRAPELWPAPSVRLLAHPPAAGSEPVLGRDHRVVVAIGPDGGWVPFEIELLGKQGFAPFSLGPRSLRGDVATIAALARLDLLRPR